MMVLTYFKCNAARNYDYPLKKIRDNESDKLDLAVAWLIEL